nr:putative inorganic phosphate cotransporter [Parasteatoda tepidariorum]
MTSFYKQAANAEIAYISGSQYLVVSVFAPPISFAADSLRSSKDFHITSIRKMMNSIGFFGSGLCAIAIAIVGCKRMMAVLFVLLWFALNSCVYSGFMVNHIDLSPQFAGTIFGITNTFATIAGSAASAAANAILSKGQTLANWDLLFFIAAIIQLFTGFIYVIFASAEQQIWTEMEIVETELREQSDTRDIIQKGGGL